MKQIGILTHRLGFNYGGMLQCYALSKYLESFGYKTIVIRRENDIPLLKLLIRSIMSICHIKPYYNPNANQKVLNTHKFPEMNLHLTRKIHSHKQMVMLCKKYGLDAVIVGSDQVWRADFAMSYGYNYFLDFVPDHVTKLSYAASFGLSEWCYTQEQTKRIKTLVSRFKALSVRESEAVDLCKKNLGVEVEQMPDPTMLLNMNDYDKVASSRLVPEPYVFLYWLGDIDSMNQKISELEQQGKKVINISLRETRTLPSVEDWVSYIKYAERVVTDSFHGCVFSIIYHKQLIVCYHKSYGRISSLLQLFNTDEERMKTIGEDDYVKIDKIMNSERERARCYLLNALN